MYQNKYCNNHLSYNKDILNYNKYRYNYYNNSHDSNYNNEQDNNFFAIYYFFVMIYMCFAPFLISLYFIYYFSKNPITLQYVYIPIIISICILLLVFLPIIIINLNN